MIYAASYLFFIPLIISGIILILMRNEKLIIRISFVSILSLLAGYLILLFHFCSNNAEAFVVDLFHVNLGGHVFHYSTYFDIISFSFSGLVIFLCYSVMKFGKSYLHRDQGFYRFFALIQLFAFGLIILAIAGTLDLFFIGWEFVGMTSFLLIGYYHNRTRSIKNAFRIFSVYRICDVGLLFGAISAHLFLSKYDHFIDLKNLSPEVVNSLPHYWGIVLPLLLIIAAIGKSGQFPFLSWPARAMEGPTPSSAIFYGGLSIHCGVLLLLRVSPIIHAGHFAETFLFVIGALSFFISRIISNTIPTIKGYLAYVSVSHVGLMFIEIALGWEKLALVHMLLHAVYRCYQILVSPSVVSDFVLKGERHTPSNTSKKSSFLEVLHSTLFVIALQDGFLSLTERGFYPLPGIIMKEYIYKNLKFLFLTFFILILPSSLYWKGIENWNLGLSYSFALMAILICLYCLSYFGTPRKMWAFFGLAQVCFIFSNCIYDLKMSHGIQVFLYSAIPAWLLGFYALTFNREYFLTSYNGLSEEYKDKYKLFLLSFVAFSGYPLSTIFFAEDILFSELMGHSYFLLLLTLITIMMNGFIVCRLLVKTFWGFPVNVKV